MGCLISSGNMGDANTAMNGKDRVTTRMFWPRGIKQMGSSLMCYLIYKNGQVSRNLHFLQMEHQTSHLLPRPRLLLEREATLCWWERTLQDSHRYKQEISPKGPGSQRLGSCAWGRQIHVSSGITRHWRCADTNHWKPKMPLCSPKWELMEVKWSMGFWPESISVDEKQGSRWGCRGVGAGVSQVTKPLMCFIIPSNSR